MGTSRREIVFDAQSIREAKTETERRILGDAKRVSEAVWPILRYIADHLFDQDFDASALRNAEMPPGGRRPKRAALDELSTGLGFTVARYIKEQRMLTAKRLLETTGIEVQRIADLVAGERAQGFSSGFRSWEEKRRTPTQYRKAEGTAQYSEKDWLRAWLWLWVGILTEEQCDMMRAAERAQRGSQEKKSRWVEVPVQKLVDFLAAKGLEKTVAVYGQMECATGEFFEGASQRAREEGRKDRRRGVELAEVALAVVEGNADELGAGYLALGWARLGNARRLASDLEGAERAIRQAETWAKKAEEQDRVLAEVLRYKGTLRVFQRRFTEALAIYDEAVTLSQAAGAELALVDNLLQRASVCLYLGEPTEALPDIEKVRLLIPDEDERRRLGVVQHAMDAAILAGEPQLAREILPEARRLSLEVDDRSLSLQIRWLEGWLLRAEGELQAAEPLLKEARAGFMSLEDLGTSAIVSLDLALLYHQQGGRAGEVLHHATEALPALEALGLPESQGTLVLLRQAIGEGEVPRAVLEIVRRHLLSPHGG